MGRYADSKQQLTPCPAAKQSTLLASLDTLLAFLSAHGLASLPLSSTTETGTAALDLESETQRLQALAKDLFARRARLREGAATVGSILSELA